MPSKDAAFPTIGILGGGQLGRMTALAALRMGLHVRSLSPTASGPMDGLGDQHIGDWQDPDVLRRFAEGCAVVTAESEWVPAEEMQAVLPEGTALWPSPETLRRIRHKGRQKQLLAEAGLAVPAFTRCASLAEARQAAAAYGYPVLVKRYEGSYDGYGNATVQDDAALSSAWAELSAADGALVEAWAPFVRELAVLVARRPGGEHVVYPVTHTVQEDHRCHSVVVPAPISPATARAAQQLALAAVEAVEGVGLTAVELFELADGSLLVNELAPRPHNTGHYSIEACFASQFENHVRAILDLRLGSPELRVPAAAMVNILGHRAGTPATEGYAAALSVPDAAVHLYGKREVRPKRKMGHVTATAHTAAAALNAAERAAAALVL